MGRLLYRGHISIPRRTPDCPDFLYIDESMAHKKPIVNEEKAITIAQNIFGLLNIVEVKELMSNYDRNYFVKTAQTTSNKAGNISSRTGKFVLKFLNSLDSQYPSSILGEIEVMEFLRHKGFPCPQVCPVQNKKAELMAIVDLNTLDACADETNYEKDKNISIVRLITFLEGTMADSIERNPIFMYTIGQFVGSLSKVLKVKYELF